MCARTSCTGYPFHLGIWFGPVRAREAAQRGTLTGPRYHRSTVRGIVQGSTNEQEPRCRSPLVRRTGVLALVHNLTDGAPSPAPVTPVTPVAAGSGEAPGGRTKRSLDPRANRWLGVVEGGYRCLHDQDRRAAAMTAERVLSQEELAALLDDAMDPSWTGLGRG